jgi:ABC-2 type transport system permease protein
MTLALRKYVVITRVSLINAIQYRANVYSRFAFYTLFIYVFMSLWRAIYAEGGVQGYTHTQLVWYLIMTEFIAFTGGSGILNTINNEVKSGSVAYHLGRPTHYIVYQFASSLGQILFNMLSFGALAAALGFLFVGPLMTFRAAGIPAMLLSLTLSILMNYFFLALIGLTAFVLEDNFAIFLIYQKLTFMLGMFLPVEFLPGWLQAAAKSLPFSYVHWAPARLFVAYSRELAMELIPRQIMWTVMAVALTLLCYRAAVRRLHVNGG